MSIENFALGCTPIINLFRQRAEPIRLDNRSAEYRVVPDARRVGATEVYAIDGYGFCPRRARPQLSAFFGLSHTTTENDIAYWHASRRMAESEDGGTDVFLTFVDNDFDPAAPIDYIASVETLCLNRDLPARLPFGGGNPRLELVEASPQSPVSFAPPPRLRRCGRRWGRDKWRLISHLVLNHLSITDGRDGADALRAVLKLYDFHDSAETRALIDSLLHIGSRPGTARIPGPGVGGMCRGLDVEVEFDPAPFETGQGFLFASVIERFLALYVSINSFTRTTAVVRGRTDTLRTWQPRAGPAFFSNRPTPRRTWKVPLLPGRAAIRATVCPAGAATRPRGPRGGRRGDRPAATERAFSGGDAPLVPATEIDDVSENGAGPPCMTVTFMGLNGPSAVLPQHYSVTLWREFRNHNTALRDFLDLFNSRLIAFFYRAWAKYRVPISINAASLRARTGRARHCGLFLGFATDGLSGRAGVAEHALLHYVGFLSHFPRNTASLEALLCDYFKLPVTVQQFDGRWFSLPSDQRTRLSAAARSHSSFCRLSVDAVVGESYWDVESGFTIAIGPIDYAAFARLMPDGVSLQRLIALTRLYVSPQMGIRVALPETR